MTCDISAVWHEQQSRSSCSEPVHTKRKILGYPPSFITVYMLTHFSQFTQLSHDAATSTTIFCTPCITCIVHLDVNDLKIPLVFSLRVQLLRCSFSCSLLNYWVIFLKDCLKTVHVVVPSICSVVFCRPSCSLFTCQSSTKAFSFLFFFFIV